MCFRILTAEEAAALIRDGENVGLSGFLAGTPTATARALATKAHAMHQAGQHFKINLFTGASTSDITDGALAEAEAIAFRTPYQATVSLRNAINSDTVKYCDLHLSHMAQNMRYGALPKIDTAIIEVADITDDGEITLTTAGGNSATFCELADRIIIEWNSYHPKELKEMHDIYIPADPPHRLPIPLLAPDHRIGTHTLKIDPEKIAGIVYTNEHDRIEAFKPIDAVTEKIGENVVHFLESELQEGRIPPSFLPLQSGVGNIANSVLAALGRSHSIPPFKMYTEVIQDSVIELMKSGRCTMASSCALTVSDNMLIEIYKHIDFFKARIILRSMEISNNPEIIRRLGLICINTALEADIFGQVNSTHFFGRQIMNGIGGAGDFARNGYLTIFTCPSIVKHGAISSIVPMVTHHDQTEHDVDVIVTEQGVADLRGKSPRERAEEIINNCAHPDYKQLLRDYISLTPAYHTPHCLAKAFEMHTAFLNTGDMRNADFSAREKTSS